MYRYIRYFMYEMHIVMSMCIVALINMLFAVFSKHQSDIHLPTSKNMRKLIRTLIVVTSLILIALMISHLIPYSKRTVDWYLGTRPIFYGMIAYFFSLLLYGIFSKPVAQSD